MDRDYDGRLSFGEFMGEETPLEKVMMVDLMVDDKYFEYFINISETF